MLYNDKSETEFLKESKVFGEEYTVLEGVTLRNPNQYREAIIYETINSLSESKVEEFVESPEAKMMIDRNIISQGTIERLLDSKRDDILDTTICHIAKENDDPLWDEFVACRIQERRIMNELMDKYLDQASPVADKARSEFVENYIPKYFQK